MWYVLLCATWAWTHQQWRVPSHAPWQWTHGQFYKVQVVPTFCECAILISYLTSCQQPSVQRAAVCPWTFWHSSQREWVTRVTLDYLSQTQQDIQYIPDTTPKCCDISDMWRFITKSHTKIYHTATLPWISTTQLLRFRWAKTGIHLSFVDVFDLQQYQKAWHESILIQLYALQILPASRSHMFLLRNFVVFSRTLWRLSMVLQRCRDTANWKIGSNMLCQLVSLESIQV